MIRLILFIALFLGILDPVLLFRIGARFGLGAALAVLILPGYLGGRLARLQGYQCFSRVQSMLAKGQQPSGELVEGVTILVAGVLLVYPGPITTFVGLFLLIPVARRGLGWLLLKRWNRTMTSGSNEDVGPLDSSEGSPFGSDVQLGGDVGADGLKTVEGEDLGTTPISGEEPKALPEGSSHE